MITSTDPTILRLTGIGISPYSARGLSQTLEPIGESAHLERSINGELLDLSYAPMRKYKSTITGSDQRAPVCDGVWAGRIVTVDCISELCTPEYEGPWQRTIVPGSERYESGLFFYRPRLTMMVTNMRMDTDEWSAQVGWSIDLEEV